MTACVHGRSPWPLFVYGPTGVGKTCAVLRLCDFIGGSTYYTATELNRENIAGAKEAIGLWSDIDRASLLVLDEIGSRGGLTEAMYETMREATDVREHKPTVFVSNLAPEKIGELYDARVLSRIACGTIVEVKGKDRRFDPSGV